ncbi:MAG: ankyrin repeat domain-containing protein [Janthinobacterium lividum]
MVQWHIESTIGTFFYYNMPSDTPLHYAVRISNIGAVNTLIGYKANINAVNLYKQTPLHYIANMLHVDKNDIVIAEILLKNQANINAIDNCDGTPLNCAINNSIHANIEYNPNYAEGKKIKS